MQVGDKMIKCEVIKEFTLKRFNELKSIKRKNFDTKDKLYIGDTFKCNEDMVKYLTGNNDKGEVVVKVIEVEPEIKILSQSPIEELEKAMNVKAKITTANYSKPKNKKSSKK